MSHKCHARGCQVEVEPRMLCCLAHWRMLPKQLQMAVWRHYRAGQEVDKQPSEAYMEAQRRAIEYIATREGLEEP